MENRNPLPDLITYARTSPLHADIVLCPGDLANRAFQEGVGYGWHKLQELSSALTADGVIASPGNHDIITRSRIQDRRGGLASLVPSYPSGELFADEEFWRDGYYLHDDDPRYRVLNINSCFEFPDFPRRVRAPRTMRNYLRSVERGAINRDRIVRIAARISGLPHKPVNIVLLHHHPVENELWRDFQDTYGAMHGGTELIAMLEANSQENRWMVVHGHKHVPNYTTIGASARSPIVLCSASLGGALWNPVASRYTNQFHVIEFHLDPAPDLPETRGLVHTYQWAYGKGWEAASSQSFLPGVFGFGVTEDPRVLGNRVADALDGTGPLLWREVYSRFPSVIYQGPVDFNMFDRQLETRGWSLNRDRRNHATSITKVI
jgi:hypothetical protein